MSLFQSFKVNNAVLFKTFWTKFISRRFNSAMVLLLIVLQLIAWYPALSSANQTFNHAVMLEKKAQRDWQKVQQQDKALRHAQFDAAPWLHHEIESAQAGIASRWLVEGAASLPEWQGVLEDIQTRFALDMVSVAWQREGNGDWRARLMFHVLAPVANREYRDWLPVRFQVERFVKGDWQLLSTMQTAGNTSALLLYKKHRYWVQAGSWLPEAGLTVSSVSFDDVIFMGDDGVQRMLNVRETGGSRD